MAVILRKLIGIGQLPDDMRAGLASEGIVHLAESVPVTFRFSGRVPGKTAKGNLRSYVGALVITDARVLATLSSAPKKAVRAVDHRWSDPAGSMVTGEWWVVSEWPRHTSACNSATVVTSCRSAATFPPSTSTPTTSHSASANATASGSPT